MKPFIEKLPYSENSSFLAETYTTPHFNANWHQHVEYELIHFLKGSGHSFIGNYVGRFEPGDIYFLGSNLPHTFQERCDRGVTSAIVIQFKENFWGNDFMHLPECGQLKKLFQISCQGLKIKGDLKKRLTPLIEGIPYAKGFERIVTFSQCLLILSESGEFEPLSTIEVREFNTRDKERIDFIFQYTMENFRDGVHLPDIAKKAGMSVPVFCSYFKKRTKKTYINFVNELRIGYACKILINSQKTISQVSYESGYNSVTNFNKQFIKIKGYTPSNYRRNLLDYTWQSA
jgi:AraC-like DNA-binding protein